MDHTSTIERRLTVDKDVSKTPHTSTIERRLTVDEDVSKTAHTSTIERWLTVDKHVNKTPRTTADDFRKSPRTDSSVTLSFNSTSDYNVDTTSSLLTLSDVQSLSVADDKSMLSAISVTEIANLESGDGGLDYAIPGLPNHQLKTRNHSSRTKGSKELKSRNSSKRKEIPKEADEETKPSECDIIDVSVRSTPD